MGTSAVVPALLAQPPPSPSTATHLPQSQQDGRVLMHTRVPELPTLPRPPLPRRTLPSTLQLRPLFVRTRAHPLHPTNALEQHKTF